MNRIYLVTVLSALAVLSCARMEKRGSHYNPAQCPFCVVNPGKCDNCAATGKCSFCNGTGVRKTSTAGITDEKFKTVNYEEKCSFCAGTGVCKYCGGNGKCKFCKGTAHVESWDFFEQHKSGQSGGGNGSPAEPQKQ
jgi:hypothetical protein